jgi:uncharacterized protein YdbL (DUF1318 family)
VTASIALAGPKDDILKRMKDRLPALNDAKNAGKIGEVFSGYVESPKGDATVAALIAAENADRKALYEIDAKASGGTADAVAAAYAERFFKAAAKGHWLKGKDGVWRQKA